MNNLKLISLVILLLSISIQGCSQNEPVKEDYISRQNAENLINEKFKKKTSGKKYVIFSIAEKDFIVIIENKNFYSEHYIQYENGKEKKSKKTDIKKTNNFYIKMFNKGNYRTDFVTFNTDFFKSGYETASGNITYFVLKDKSRKSFGEARLSVFVKPNPIDAEVYLNLVNRVLYYVNLN